MKKLSEFATLAEAHAYPEDNYALVTPNAVTQAMLTCSQTEEIYLYFRNSTEQLKVAFMDVLSRGDSLDFSEDTEDGQINHLLLNGIIASEPDTAIKAALQTLKTMLTAKADNEDKPYKDTTQADLDAAHLELSMTVEEVFPLPNSIDSEVYTLTIGVDSPKKINIKIMQRFGDDETDLTPWHEAASFTNVYYKQQQYKAQIPHCDCSHRELKVVSDYQLSMSIA